MSARQRICRFGRKEPARLARAALAAIGRLAFVTVLAFGITSSFGPGWGTPLWESSFLLGGESQEGPQAYTAAAYIERARRALEAGDVARADEELQLALGADPDSAQANLMMGIVK